VHDAGEARIVLASGLASIWDQLADAGHGLHRREPQTAKAKRWPCSIANSRPSFFRTSPLLSTHKRAFLRPVFG